MKQETMDGMVIDPFPLGMRIRHKKCGLTGKIAGHEMHECGKLSAIPYKVSWDDPHAAFQQLGILNFYQCHEFLELAEQGDE